MNQEVNKIQVQTPVDIKAIKTFKTLLENASIVEKFRKNLALFSVIHQKIQSNAKKVKFKETLEVIPDVEQLCTIDGHQYHTFNKNS